MTRSVRSMPSPRPSVAEDEVNAKVPPLPPPRGGGCLGLSRNGCLRTGGGVKFRAGMTCSTIPATSF